MSEIHGDLPEDRTSPGAEPRLPPVDGADDGWVASTLAAIEHAVFVTDADGRFVYVNPAFESLTGYSAAEALGEGAGLLNSGVHDDAYFADLWGTITDGEVWEGEILNRRKDGSRYLANQTVTPVTDDETGAVAYFVAMHTDLTDLRRTETSLERMQSLLRRTEAAAEVGGWELHLGTGRLVWTPQTRVIHEAPADYEPTLEEAVAFYHPDDRDRVRALVERAMEWRVPYELEGRIITFGGRTRVVQTTGEFFGSGADGGLHGTIRDVTDEVSQRQRLMVLNRVLRHNLRNDLNVLLGGADVLASFLREDGDGPAVSDEEALEWVETMTATAEDLLALSEQVREFEELYDDADYFQEVPVASFLETVADAARERYPDATFAVESTPATLLCNRDALRACVDELVDNALEHTPPSATTVTVFAESTADGELHIGVSDEGDGLPPVDREVIEEEVEDPVTHLDGLGLWVVRWLLQPMGGDLELQAERASGASVVAAFPPSKWRPPT